MERKNCFEENLLCRHSLSMQLLFSFFPIKAGHYCTITRDAQVDGYYKSLNKKPEWLTGKKKESNSIEKVTIRFKVDREKQDEERNVKDGIMGGRERGERMKSG